MKALLARIACVARRVFAEYREIGPRRARLYTHPVVNSRLNRRFLRNTGFPPVRASQIVEEMWVLGGRCPIASPARTRGIIKEGIIKAGYSIKSGDASKERLMVWLESLADPRAGGHPREKKESLFAG
jgi:hypothetical protein